MALFGKSEHEHILKTLQYDFSPVYITIDSFILYRNSPRL